MKVLAASALVGLSTASLTSDYQWHAWKNQHQINFKTAAEESMRYRIFKQNREFVNSHNARAANGEETYTVELNKFAALDSDEFEAKYLNKKMEEQPRVGIVLEYQCEGTYSNSGNAIPAELSYVTGRAGFNNDSRVTKVKDQGSCGSCWSFASTAVVEATMCENGSQNCDNWNGLSPQNLVDCLSYTSKGDKPVNLNPYDDHGCSGGFITNGVRSIEQLGGVMSWDDYPYVSGSTKTEGQCVYDPTNAYLNIVSGCQVLPANDEVTMADALAQKGPLGVGINASGPGFQLYSSGVYSNSRCSARLNHAVTVTGMGNLGGMDYWEIKNSWSGSWGDKGFINVQRGNGMCGLGADSMFAES